MFEFDTIATQGAEIKVIGVGGGGGNAVKRMIDSELSGVEFIIANTDNQALAQHSAKVKIQIGDKRTKGLGAGGEAECGRHAAEEDRDKIKESLEGADLVFLTCGEGGGTGTGAAPVVAQVSRECGALTVGVVTKPFSFEGRRRMAAAEKGIEALKKYVDALIIIPNDRLMEVAPPDMTVKNAFSMADNILTEGVKGISDLIIKTGMINLDFADVRSVMCNAGSALMGMGQASGESRAKDAAIAAISSPLLETKIEGARGLLVNISGSKDMTLHEINTAMTIIQNTTDENCNIIFGTVEDESLNDEIKITVIATGFGDNVSYGNQRHENHTVIERPQVTRTEPIIEEVMTQVPVKQPETSSEDNLLIPAFLRNTKRNSA